MGSVGGPLAIALPRLHVIAGDEELAGPGFRDVLAGLVAVGGGRLAVHLRARGMSAARLYEVAKGAVEVGGTGGTLVVVNDRLDVALAVGAGGVHLREDSMGPREVRGVVGEGGRGGRGFLVGRSIHAPEQAAELAVGGVDYLVLGSVYETASHPGGRSDRSWARWRRPWRWSMCPCWPLGEWGWGKSPNCSRWVHMEWW